jgi:hypothetical protein
VGCVAKDAHEWAEVIVHDGRRTARDEQQREAAVAEAILAYLAAHPQATDTLEGIAEWWLLRQRVREEVGRVARVLRRLADDGLLEQVGTGPACRYRLSARAAEDGKRPTP